MVSTDGPSLLSRPPSASAANKRLTVSDETTSSMRVSWAAAPGRVSHYRLRHVPSGGGREVSLKVPGTSMVLQRLRPLTSYNITVHPIYKRGEGKARQGVGTTRTLLHHSTSLTDAATFSPSHTSTHTPAAFPPAAFLLPYFRFLQNSRAHGNAIPMCF